MFEVIEREIERVCGVYSFWEDCSFVTQGESFSEHPLLSWQFSAHYKDIVAGAILTCSRPTMSENLPLPLDRLQEDIQNCGFAVLEMQYLPKSDQIFRGCVHDITTPYFSMQYDEGKLVPYFGAGYSGSLEEEINTFLTRRVPHPKKLLEVMHMLF